MDIETNRIFARFVCLPQVVTPISVGRWTMGLELSLRAIACGRRRCCLGRGGGFADAYDGDDEGDGFRYRFRG